MDDLTMRYAKALTAEHSLHVQRERSEQFAADLKRREMLRQLAADPKTAQWKLDLSVEEALDGNNLYQFAADQAFDHRCQHEKAKLRLKVIEERLSLRRAELYARKEQG